MLPWQRWIALTCLVLLLILVPFALWEEPITALSTRLLEPAAGRLVLAAVVVLLLGSDVLLPIPSSFISAAAVALLGAGWGTAAVALGMTMGAWLGYAIGRWGGEPLVRRVAGPSELERAARLFERFDAWVLLVCRGVPVLAEASTLFAGAVRLGALRFGLITGLGNGCLALAYAMIAMLELQGTAAWLMPFVFGLAVPGLAIVLLRRVAGGSR